MYLKQAEQIKRKYPILKGKAILCILPTSEPNQSKVTRRIFIALKSVKSLDEIDIDSITKEVEKYDFSVFYLSYTVGKIVMSPVLR